MKCTKCGTELSEGVNVCPACGAYSISGTPESENKDEQNFALELKEKIVRMIREEKNFDEANNFIDLYLSMIGMDAEIIEYQKEIRSKTNQEREQTQAPSTESPDGRHSGKIPEQDKNNIQGLEIEINQIPEQFIKSEGDQKPDDNEEIFLPDTKGDFLELDDEISFGDISDEKIEKISSPKQDNLQNQDTLELADESEDEVLVLGADDEILELEEDMVESPVPESQKKDEYKKKDILSQIEIEINQEAKKPETAGSSPDSHQAEFELDILRTPNETLISEPSGESGSSDLSHEKGLFSSDPVESMLDDLKEKKRKVKRWLLIALATIAFIALIITLYFLSADKNDSNQITESPLPARQSSQKTSTAQKTRPDQSQSMQQKTYLDNLARAREFLNKNDIQNAEKMIGRAKKIATTETLITLEQDLKKKRAELEILKDIEVRENQPEAPDTSEERAYKKAKASSSRSLYQDFLVSYPHGKYAAEIRKEIKELDRKERDDFRRQLIQKLETHRKITCRNYPQSLTEDEIQTLISNKETRISHTVEIQTIDGDRVIINFTTGLMWHQWRETMDFRKAKWWASREHAGYFDWRLPTAEEASTLSKRDIQNLIPGNAPNYELWTGDTDSRDSRKAWVYSPSGNNFTSVVEDQYRQLWSVRLIKKSKGKRLLQ